MWYTATKARIHHPPMFPTQDYVFKPVRSSLILTNSYVAGTIIGSNDIHRGEYNQLILLIDFTIGSLTSAQIKVEFSNDNSDFYQETVNDITAGVIAETVAEHSFSATGKYRIAIPIKDRFVKVSAKGTGTVTSSSIKIGALIGVV